MCAECAEDVAAAEHDVGSLRFVLGHILDDVECLLELALLGEEVYFVSVGLEVVGVYEDGGTECLGGAVVVCGGDVEVSEDEQSGHFVGVFVS